MSVHLHRHALLSQNNPRCGTRNPGSYLFKGAGAGYTLPSVSRFDTVLCLWRPHLGVVSWQGGWGQCTHIAIGTTPPLQRQFRGHHYVLEQQLGVVSPQGSRGQGTYVHRCPVLTPCFVYGARTLASSLGKEPGGNVHTLPSALQHLYNDNSGGTVRPSNIRGGSGIPPHDIVHCLSVINWVCRNERQR